MTEVGSTDLRREMKEIGSKENGERGLKRSREMREMEELVLRRMAWNRERSREMRGLKKE